MARLKSARAAGVTSGRSGAAAAPGAPAAPAPGAVPVAGAAWPAATAGGAAVGLAAGAVGGGGGRWGSPLQAHSSASASTASAEPGLSAPRGVCSLKTGNDILRQLRLAIAR